MFLILIDHLSLKGSKLNGCGKKFSSLLIILFPIFFIFFQIRANLGFVSQYIKPSWAFNPIRYWSRFTGFKGVERYLCESHNFSFLLTR